MECYANLKLPLGYRVLAGLGFWVVGTSAAIGALDANGATMSTKIHQYNAELDGAAMRQARLERALDSQQTQVVINLVSAVICISVGAGMTRDIDHLWSGPAYGQETAGEQPFGRPAAEEKTVTGQSNAI